MICEYCGKEYNPSDVKGNFRKRFCSNHCYEDWCKWNKTPNCKCATCGKEFYLKPSRIKKCKHGVTCSIECMAKYKSIWFSGENNHQFGLKGELNASFKGKEIKHKNHDIIDIYVYCPEHPYANRDGRVVKHRLVVEQNYNLYDEKFFDVINDFHILKKEYQIHHKDGNHDNNDVNNLEILTRSEHTSEHNKEKEIIRDPTTGRITGVVKREELLETPEEDNQQPSLELTIEEGSETNSII